MHRNQISTFLNSIGFFSRFVLVTGSCLLVEWARNYKIQAFLSEIGTSKGQIKTKAGLAHHRFSQKTNKQI